MEHICICLPMLHHALCCNALMFQGGASFVDHVCCFCLVVFCFHARLFVDALWSPAGKGLTS